MLRAMKAVALGFITIACCAFVLGAWPAFAQEKKPLIVKKTNRNLIAPDMSHVYARYYVPYGIIGIRVKY